MLFWKDSSRFLPIYESKFGVPTSDFTPQKHTITKHVHIHSWTLHGWLAINDQWSIHSIHIFHIMEWNGSVQSTSYPHNLQPYSTTSGLEQLPTQLSSQCNCLPPFQPYHFTLRSILCFVRFHIFGGIVVWNGGGLDLESVQSRKKKWAEQLGRRWEKKSMLSQCLMMVVKVFVVQILFYSVSLVRIAW